VGVRIAVVGGGISGLTAAHRLAAAGHDVVCFDPGDRPGGLVRTERVEGFLCELGPESILDGAPATRALVEELGLEGQVVRAAPAARRRLVYVDGRLRPVPSGPFSLLSSDILSAAAKWRLVRESGVPPRDPDSEPGESVYDFGARRLGDEAARKLVAPAVIGIFAGDARDLEVKTAFPRLVALETRHGSLTKGLRAMRREGGAPGRSFSFRDGLERLPAALAARLGARLRRARAVALGRDGGRDGSGGRWSVRVEDVPSGAASTEIADAVVVAASPRAAAGLVEPVVPEAAALARVPLAPAAIVFLGFRAGPPDVDLGAYGFLVARGEGPTMLGAQFESSVFPGRAPAGGALIRCILGGTFEPGVVAESDEALAARARQDLRAVLGLERPPDFVLVRKLAEGIPQYRLGHDRLVAAIEAAAARAPGLHLLGYALRGVAVNDCIRNAAALAQALGGPGGGAARAPETEPVAPST
jgi:oxygen-dependent protoporphyrinogen oxidase